MRDCENCKHRKENGCEKWECEFEPKMTEKQAKEWLLAIQEKYIHSGDDEMDAKRKEAIAMAIRSLAAWEKAKAKLGNYSLYPVNEWVGLKRAMKIVLETLGEVGETE